MDVLAMACIKQNTMNHKYIISLHAFCHEKTAMVHSLILTIT
jgi:hypothetical protein